MLLLFLATFMLFLLVIAAMSVGYIVKRKTIYGSCGGIATLGLEKECHCPEPCDARKKHLVQQVQAYQQKNAAHRIL